MITGLSLRNFHELHHWNLALHRPLNLKNLIDDLHLWSLNDLVDGLHLWNLNRFLDFLDRGNLLLRSLVRPQLCQCPALEVSPRSSGQSATLESAPGSPRVHLLGLHSNDLVSVSSILFRSLLSTTWIVCSLVVVTSQRADHVQASHVTHDEARVPKSHH